MTFIKLAYIQILLLVSVTMSATGPSFLQAKIHPIRMNKDGAILCKTLFTANGMGGATYDIFYGVCILNDDQIKEYPIFKINTDDTESQPDPFTTIEQWDNWFDSSYNNTKDTSSVIKKLIAKYNFTICDLSSFSKNDTLNRKDFEKKYKIDLSKYRLKALQGGQSISDSTDSVSDSIIVSYNFGNLIITKNIDNADDFQIGLPFDYKNETLSGYIYDNKPIDCILYEMQEVDGILFFPNRKNNRD